MTVMDWGHDERDYAAGHSDRAPRLDEAGWAKLVSHFKGLCERANSYGVRPVLHPHCGGYIEFADEIDVWLRRSRTTWQALFSTPANLQYAGMDPVEWLRKYKDRLDYVHFKDIDHQGL